MAAGSGAIRAGRAFIEIFTEDSAVGRGLRAISGQVSSWGGSVNKLGASLGSAIGSTFSVMAQGAKIAGFAIAGVGAGLLGAAKLFAESDRTAMSGEQAAAADRMRESFAALMSGATALNNTFMTALQPGIEAVVDIVRLGMNAFKEWVNANGELLTAVTDFLGGVRDALSAGDIALAAEIAWAGVKVAWAAGVAWVMETTNGWKTSLQQTMSEAFIGLEMIATNVWNGIADAAQAAADFMVDIFQSAVGAVGRAFAFVGEKIGLLEEGTAAQLGKDQEQNAAERQAAREKRDKATAKSRIQAEDDFGQTVIDANKSIAEANRAAIDAAKADFEAKRQELVGLQDKAKQNAQAIPPGLQKVEQDLRSTAGAFGGSRSLGQIAGDLSGKSIAENTRETAKNTKASAEALKTIAAGGLAIGVT